ncbi:putative esterase [Catenovulum agarivorans DS-2]|uniref:Putative esterase n=1 Tax=Catenovulum agarivorans DS-2 TaxID=1328313 RepID=W7QCT6_9ALTE|nr:alpha/beta hydrolase-fold protein [Catenovulum agarivorans]EWH10704.1 putative esterase [Catenovulum agarivorans DS-2]
MAINRLEISNPAYTPDNTKFVTVHSSNLQRRHDIVLYNSNAQGENLPVVVLMHGVYGNAWVWMYLGGIHLAYEKVQAELGGIEFILAMPSDGGLYDGSAYLPLKKHADYDKWITEDVIAAVKQVQDTVSDSSRFYISGLSMGGYGALRLGAKYPNLFSGISAHSSITKIDDMAHFVPTELSEYQCDNQRETDICYWLEQNKSDIPPLRFDCGVDDVLYQSNLNLENKLKTLAVNYTFDSFEGEHSWEYWHQHVQTTFKFFAKLELSAKNID